jgi:hypothetical protein
MADTGESAILGTYAGLLSLTRQTIINDSFDFFSQIPAAAGRSAIRTIGDLVYQVLFDNPKMSDGHPLFSDEHGNVITGSRISVDSLSEMETLMGLQTDAKGSALNIDPEFLLVGRREKRRSISLMTSEFDPDSDGPNRTNDVRDLATPISDARIDLFAKEKGVPVPNFLVSSKDVDTVKVFYLDGVDIPFVEQETDFKSDGVAFKVRIDAAVSSTSYKSIVKNPGVAASA